MQGIPTSKVLLCRAVYCIDSSLGAFVNVLVFVHGPHLLDASTAHGIACLLGHVVMLRRCHVIRLEQGCQLNWRQLRPQKPHLYDYFSLFFTHNLFCMITMNTNQYVSIPCAVEASRGCGPCTNTKILTDAPSEESMQYTALQRRTLLAGIPRIDPIIIETII